MGDDELLDTDFVGGAADRLGLSGAEGCRVRLGLGESNDGIRQVDLLGAGLLERAPLTGVLVLLRGVPELTVVTNSMRIADVLHNAGPNSPNVVLTGGVRTPSDALVGPIAVCSLRLLHLDLVFMGVHGMDARAGFTTPNLLEADTNQALVAAGQRLVVLADHTKWGTVGISTIVPLDQADVVVSDDGLATEARNVLEESAGELVLAQSRPATESQLLTP